MAVNFILECAERVSHCNCSLCLNFENFFGTKIDTPSISEISAPKVHEVCKANDCRKCYCANYEPCKGLVGCAFYVQ